MNVFERPVHVSINNNPLAKHSGVIWCVNDGTVSQTPFIIDKPGLVRKGFNPTTYNRVIRQFNKMGYQPDTIELHMGDVNYVYDGKRYANKVGIPMPVKHHIPKEKISLLEFF